MSHPSPLFVRPTHLNYEQRRFQEHICKQGVKKQNIYFDTDAKRASTVFHKLVLSFCSLFKPAQWFSVPGRSIIRLPLSAETQELDHKRQFHRSIRKFHTGIYKKIQMGVGVVVVGGEKGPVGWGDVRRYVTFYSQDAGDKSRKQWKCPAAACITKKHRRLDTFIYSALMPASEAADDGSRTQGAALQ